LPARPRTDLATTAADGSRDGGGTTGSYVLIVGDSKLITRRLPPRGELVLGRDPDCDVTLDDARISRRHAKLIVEGADLRIADLGSTNGLKVGGAQFPRGASIPLRIGDSVRLGPYTLLVLSHQAGPTSDGAVRAAVVVRDPSVRGSTDMLERIARHDVGVLIQGETGTGKEVLARTLHTLSQRPGELVAINCAALTGTLLESDLFGHERGAFTGAHKTKPGLFEVAGKGTVLLDEIGDLPLELQGKLLRALEAREVYRVGGVQPIALHARVVAASHRSLPELVARGAFREDLYFRLNGITLELVPLRERRDAIATLANEFLAEVARDVHFTPAAMAALTSHAWPGNVRELKLVVARAALLANAGTIDVRHVLLEAPRSSTPAPSASSRVTGEEFAALAKQHSGNATAIARALGTSRSHVRRLASRFGVDLEALRS